MKQTIKVQVQHGNGAEWETTLEINAGPKNLMKAMDQLQKEIDYPGRKSVGGYSFRVLIGGEILPFYDYPTDLADARKTLGLRAAGRPAEMSDGARRNIYIDDASWEIAQRLGGGNASEGIRKALAIADAAK